MDLEQRKHVAACLEQIRTFEKAARRYVRANPSPSEAEAKFNRTFAELVKSLQQPPIKEAVESYLGEAHREALQQARDLLTKPETLDTLPMSHEWRVADAMGFSKQKATKVLTSRTYPEDVVVSLPATIDELLENLHETRRQVIEQVTQMRSLSKAQLPTKEKRRRKRDIERGVWSSLLGTGAIVGNSVLIGTFGIASGVVSYAIGGAAIHQAGRDFIGEPVDPK